MTLMMDYSLTDEFSSHNSSALNYSETRKLLSPDFQDLDDAEVEDIFYEMFGDSITPEDVEFSFKSLGRSITKIGRQVAPVAAKIAPIAGAAIGTAIAPGVGTAIGGALGSVAGQALGRASQSRSKAASPRAAQRPRAVVRRQPTKRRRQGQQPSRQRRNRGRRFPRGVQASPAAAQLTALIANPQIQRALLSLLMGSAGRQSVRVAGENVPIGAVANTIEVYARAAAEEHAALQPHNETAFSYLLDDYGEFLIDPASQEERAALVYELVEEDSQALADSADATTEQNNRQHLRDQLEQFYEERAAEQFFSEDEFEEDEFEEELELIEDDDMEFNV